MDSGRYKAHHNRRGNEWDQSGNRIFVSTRMPVVGACIVRNPWNLAYPNLGLQLGRFETGRTASFAKAFLGYIRTPLCVVTLRLFRVQVYSMGTQDSRGIFVAGRYFGCKKY